MEEVLKMDIFDISEHIKDVRQEARNYINNKRARILEIGPLNRSLLERSEYQNYFFCDIRSTDEIKKFYKGNNYLKKTGINVDIETIINIDYVLKGSYKNTFSKIEKFDYVIVSHVLEHVPNIIDFFIDIQNVLKTGGKLVIIYPDKRFSFDYFRSDSRFVDAYKIFNNSNEGRQTQELDFKINVVPENNSTIYWDYDQKVENYLIDEINQEDLETLNEDIHYWPFSDYSFIKFLSDCNRFSLFNSFIERYIPTQFSGQEFLVILSFGGKTASEDYIKYLIESKEYYFNNFLHLADLKMQNKNKDELIKLLSKNIGELGNKSHGNIEKPKYFINIKSIVKIIKNKFTRKRK